MKRALGALLATAVLLSGCADEESGTPLPTDRLAFPTGLALHPSGRWLYVVSSNFSLAYRTGAVTALPLDEAAGAIAAGRAAVAAGGAPVERLLCADGMCPRRVAIDSFGGPAVIDGGTERVFTAARGANALWGVSLAADGSLACPDGGPCARPNVSVDLDADRAGRLPLIDPFAVAAGEVATADGGTRRAIFVAQLRSPGEIGVSATSVPVAAIPADASPDDPDGQVLFTRDLGAPAVGGLLAAPGGRLLASGRFIASGFGPVRVIEGAGVPQSQVRVVDLFPSLGSVESRGMALASDGRRVYVATRVAGTVPSGVDALAELELRPADAAEPLVLRRSVPLPLGPSEVHVIARPGRADLVVVSCSEASALLVYDAEAGAVVAQVRLARDVLGGSPFGMAHRDLPGGGAAELFVSLFRDERVAVLDVPHGAPERTQVVAYLGAPPPEVVQ